MDVCAVVAFFSQVTEKTFNPHIHELVNKIIRHLNSSSKLGLKFPQPELNSLYLLVYSDASINSSHDHRCQIEFIILLADGTGFCSILQFGSHTSLRVTGYNLAGETIALSYAFDNEYLLKHNLQRILEKFVPILMLTD